MARLEELTRGAQVRGLRPDGPVTVVDVNWFGTAALELTFKDAQGRPGNELLYRTDEARLEVGTKGPAWNFDADGNLFRLVSEAYRIKLAYLFDPLLAVHTSLVEPLPHQILAVYQEMLPRQPLRFLLADDPGAGKTIMAGLFIKEFRDGVHVIDPADMMRRLVKEHILRFDGTPLFPERRAYSPNYKLSDAEAKLYKDVTEYVREEFNRADNLEEGRRGTVGFALTILQRRLASSPTPEATCRSRAGTATRRPPSRRGRRCTGPPVRSPQTPPRGEASGRGGHRNVAD